MDTNYNIISQSKTLDYIHRVIISKALNDKEPITTIARELKFSRQTIHKEIKRGTVIHRNSDLTEQYVYDFYAGQHNHETALSLRGRLSKIDDNRDLYEYIIKQLKNKKSPEVISYLVNTNSQFEETISAKTIYNWVENGSLGLSCDVLPYAKRKRKSTRKQEKNPVKPNGGESIELRPDISDRIEFGHWEIDCVVGKRNGKSTCLMTLVERNTRYGIIIKIAKKSKKCVVNALKKLKAKYGKYFYDVFKTITADNGSEFKDAIGMSLRLKGGKQIRIYYAHAYSSWERGTNENFNKIIRRWYPKGTNFENITQERIEKLARWINNYPRKQFGFRSSLSLYEAEITKIKQ